MPVKAVQISLDDELLRRIDANPETRRRGRSAFVRSAIELYLRATERKRIEERIVKAYRGRADEMETEISDLITEQAWPLD
jgi:metal-responsive CopG/Arc/MetJ family transcriptional regulator